MLRPAKNNDMTIHSKPNTALILKTEIHKRFIAFATTCLAVFLTICLIWPLSVTGFRSVAGINVRSSGKLKSKELEEILAAAVQQEIRKEKLDQIIEQIESSGTIQSKHIEYHDVAYITKAMRIGVDTKDDGYQMRVVLDGEGGPDERQLIDILSQRVARRISIEQGGLFAGTAAEQAKQAQWALDQIESELATAKQQFGRESRGNGESPFQYASSSRIVEGAPAESEIASTLEAIDLHSLRNILNQIENGSGEVVNPTDGIAVVSLTKSATLPISGVPSPGSLIALLGLSGFVGVVVAWHFNPFANTGFRTTNQIEQQLGIPIIATLSGDTPVANAKLDIETNWANALVRFSGLVLLGITTIIVGFMLISPEVRDAFWQNPFFGCARIVRIFVGY